MTKPFDVTTSTQNDYANDHDNQIDNKSNNIPFNKILGAQLKRRQVLSGGVTAAVGGFFASMTPIALATASSSGNNKQPLIGFKPVAISDGNGPLPTISEDYQYEVLIPWGEPVEPKGPAYQYPPNAKDQAEQIGIGHDGMHFFPQFKRIRQGKKSYLRRSNDSGFLAINHEFGRNSHVLGKDAPESLEDVRTSQHAHGVSVVAIEKSERKGGWKTRNSKNARRIHVNTPVCFSGPAAKSELLKTPNGNVPLGTVNNCSNGHTPWGTYLTCEENFNGYFGASQRDNTWLATPQQERYGFSENGFGYGWHLFDRRFDLSDTDYQNEENRFGWVVEIDPYDASQTPVKRTALGRFKHEGVAITVGADNRVVAYMGDDQRFDYIYKFVSAGDWRTMRDNGISPLDEGQLYVAKFSEGGVGEWLELTINTPILAKAFNDQAEVLTYARLAADLLGATPMDRPEWTTVAPNGDVFCTLTNNSRRTEPNVANPLAPNSDGHIIRWHDADDHIGTTFTWDIFLFAKDSQGTEDAYSDPDGIFADPDGRLFIQTDGGQPDDLNNQLLIADIKTGEIRRLLTGVTRDEITGITMTPDRRTLFVNTQHPGNGDPTLTNFPAQPDGVTIPRDATLVITRKDGGIIGS